MTPPEPIQPLDAEMLQYFARKGIEGGPAIAQVGNANGVKVRRIAQLVCDLSKGNLRDLSVLDLACGEGVYSVELALRGAAVRGLDARRERMQHGIRFAERLGLTKLQFDQADVRQVTVAAHGPVDVVLFLGILYHLDVPDSFAVLRNLAQICQQFLIIDTHVALHGKATATWEGQEYAGMRLEEHGASDSASVRQGRVLMSIDNPQAFWFTKPALVQLLTDVGFTTVLECHAPVEPNKPNDRVTLVALKGTPALISTYPWVNHKSDRDIELFLQRDKPPAAAAPAPAPTGTGGALKRVVNAALRPLGFEMRRVRR